MGIKCIRRAFVIDDQEMDHVIYRLILERSGDVEQIIELKQHKMSYPFGHICLDAALTLLTRGKALASSGRLASRQICRESSMTFYVALALCFSLATDALDYFRNNSLTDKDVIFLDINMPLMTGFEFLSAA